MSRSSRLKVVFPLEEQPLIPTTTALQGFDITLGMRKPLTEVVALSCKRN
jgi:hypothetical protein